MSILLAKPASLGDGRIALAMALREFLERGHVENLNVLLNKVGDCCQNGGSCETTRR